MTRQCIVQRVGVVLRRLVEVGGQSEARVELARAGEALRLLAHTVGV